MHWKVMPSICFFGAVCVGIGAEKFMEFAMGSDHAVVSSDKTTREGGAGWKINTLLTQYAEYSQSDVDKYNKAVAKLDSNDALVTGGFWLYATWPHFKIWPELQVMGPVGCGAGKVWDPLFEFKPTRSYYDKLEGDNDPARRATRTRTSFFPQLAPRPLPLAPRATLCAAPLSPPLACVRRRCLLSSPS